MKKGYFILFLFLSLSSYSQSAKDKLTVVDPSEIIKDLMSWLYYERDYLVWSADYIALDTSLQIISKNEFLERLTTGRYLPLKIRTEGASLCYQLYELKKPVDNDIVATIKNIAQKQLQYYKMEGLILPDFNFVDLENNLYNIESTKDKIILLNCWFVECQPCVAEIPSLNQLVKQFGKRKDILFVALTINSEAVIRKFLTENTFKYAIVPDKEDYLKNKLKIIGYPTHLIINRRGAIVKVIESNKISDLREVLIKELER